MSGIVYLVGAGPGDPGLITKRGLDLLRRADAVVVDALVNPLLLKECPRAAQYYVGKRGGSKHAVPQQKINTLLVRLAKQKKIVVRLKGGDPFVFGRGGEEVEALRAAHVPYEIVPGVTSAIAAPAYAGIPVSDRRWSSQVTFFTGHEGKPSQHGSAGVDWKALRPSGTLVVLMGVAEWSSIRKNLAKHGWPEATPVAAIESGTLPNQRVINTSLNFSERDFKKRRLKAPAVIVVGQVARLARTRGWLPAPKPLVGKTVVVTRSLLQNEQTIELLNAGGATVIQCPAIKTRPLGNNRALREIFSHLDTYDWVVLLSPNAVNAFSLLLKSKKSLIRKTKICVVGPATAKMVRRHGWKVSRMAREFNSVGVVAALGNVRGKKILLPRVQNAPEGLTEALRRRGAMVDEVATYTTVAAPPPPVAVKKKILASADAVMFTSVSTVRFFLKFFSKKEWTALFANAVAMSIGPSTTAALKQYRVKNILQAKQATGVDMVDTLSRFLA